MSRTFIIKAEAHDSVKKIKNTQIGKYFLENIQIIFLRAAVGRGFEEM